MGDLAGGTFASIAFAVSADGGSVTGWSMSGSGREAFVWTQGTGMTGLGDLPGGMFFSVGRGVTDGGTTVIGSASNTAGWEAMRWTAGGGMTGLGDLVGDNNTIVTAVTPDCRHYAGYGSGPSGTEAYLGSVDGTKQRLGDLPGGNFSSNAYGLSPDGSIVVGSSSVAAGFEAFRWTAAGGMQGLGDLPGGRHDSTAQGVTADGSIIIGYATSATGTRAVMWDASGTITDLNDYLPTLGINLGSWVLEIASAITPDGRYITGSGISPAGESESWIACIAAGGNSFESLWGDAAALPQNWFGSAWYGLFNAAGYPHIMHLEHGWQYCQGGDPQSVRFYDHALNAWLWTSASHYPLLYRLGAAPGWLWYVRGGRPGARQFYDYAAKAYIGDAGP